MLRIDGEHQAVEETAALGSRPIEQRVHGGRQPYDAQVIGEGRRRGDRLSRSTRHLREGADILAGRRIDAGAERGEPQHALDLGRHRPGAVALGERQLFHGGAAQAPARRQQRDRLDQIGLAGAVGPGQHHRPGWPKLDLRGVIAAEIGEAQTADEG